MTSNPKPLNRRLRHPAVIRLVLPASFDHGPDWDGQARKLRIVAQDHDGSVYGSGFELLGNQRNANLIAIFQICLGGRKPQERNIGLGGNAEILSSVLIYHHACREGLRCLGAGFQGPSANGAEVNRVGEDVDTLVEIGVGRDLDEWVRPAGSHQSDSEDHSRK